MYIPFAIVKNGNWANFTRRDQNVTVFKDKCVSKATSPLLYNIELGLARTDSTLNGISAASKIYTLKSSRLESARKLLERINIVRVNIPQEYSLLTDVAADMGIDNPNIRNTQIFENTFNKYILATDKFPVATDPFYKFDGGNISAFSYVQEKSENNKIMERKDMSKIAAGIVSLNMLEKYNGQSKYFLGSALGVE